jgi:hypothetical protein
MIILQEAIPTLSLAALRRSAFELTRKLIGLSRPGVARALMFKKCKDLNCLFR